MKSRVLLVVPRRIATTGCGAIRRLSLLFLLGTTGCVFGGDPSIDGSWSGSVGGANFSMTVTEQDKTVTGAATLSGTRGGQEQVRGGVGFSVDSVGYVADLGWGEPQRVPSITYPAIPGRTQN